MLEKIKALILDNYCVADNEGGKYTLKEDALGASCNEVQFNGKHNYIIFKFDQKIKYEDKEIDHLFPFYTRKKGFSEGLSSMCDYIIFYKNKKSTDLLAVICNLKSGNKANNTNQVKAGEIFARFIFDTAKRHYAADKDFQNVELFNFKVLFSSKELYKNYIDYKTNTLNNQNGILNLIADEHFNIDEWYRFKKR